VKEVEVKELQLVKELQEFCVLYAESMYMVKVLKGKKDDKL
jgi:hypothetical protein